MKLRVATAGGGESWEAGLVQACQHGTAPAEIVQRCFDLGDLLAVAVTGRPQVALVTAGLRWLDREAVTRLADAGLPVVGVAPTGDEPAEIRLRQIGVAGVAMAHDPPERMVATAAAVVEARRAGQAASDRSARAPERPGPGTELVPPSAGPGRWPPPGAILDPPFPGNRLPLDRAVSGTQGPPDGPGVQGQHPPAGPRPSAEPAPPAERAWPPPGSADPALPAWPPAGSPLSLPPTPSASASIADPGLGSQPARPGQPDGPGQPDRPRLGNQPDRPGSPDRPGLGSQPARPGQPDGPGQPDRPRLGNQPDRAAQPDWRGGADLGSPDRLAGADHPAGLGSLADASRPAGPDPRDPAAGPGPGPDATPVRSWPPAAVVPAGPGRVPEPVRAQPPATTQAGLPEQRRQPAPGEWGGGHGQPGKIVAVWGPKGAPGRTTIALNLAFEAAPLVGETLLVDADTYGGSVAQSLGFVEDYPGLAWAARLANRGDLDVPKLWQAARRAAPDGPRVLTGLPRAELWTEIRPATWEHLLGQFREAFPLTVLDVGFCLEEDEELLYDQVRFRRNAVARIAVERADLVVAVVRADPVGLHDFIRGWQAFQELGVGTDRIRLVVNQLRSGLFGGDTDEQIRTALARYLGMEPVGFVPYDRAAMDAALLAARALAEARPSSPAREAIAELARTLLGVPVEPARAGKARRPLLATWLGRGPSGPTGADHKEGPVGATEGPAAGARPGFAASGPSPTGSEHRPGFGAGQASMGV